MIGHSAGAELEPEHFATIAGLVHRICGIHLQPGKEVLVRTRLARRLGALGLTGFGEYIDYLGADRSGQEIATMVDALTTNKTNFFREPPHFDFLRERIVPEWLERSAPIRIWSAGCSTGEEPYTLSIVLQEEIPDLAGRDLRILATDISDRVLQRARQGRYEPEAVAQIPDQLRGRYFHPDGDRVRVSDAARAPIRFARLNLMEPWPMRGSFDLILCRNVMIYFDAATQQALVSRFAQRLRPGGFLFVGHSESLTSLEHDLRYIRPAVYQK